MENFISDTEINIKQKISCRMVFCITFDVWASRLSGQPEGALVASAAYRLNGSSSVTEFQGVGMQDFTFGKIRIHFHMEHGVVISNTPGRRVAWIRTKAGDELRLEYGFEDFQLRTGHEVSVIYASSSYREYVSPVVLRNHHLSLSYALGSSDVIYKEMAKPLTWSFLALVALIIPSAFIAKWFGHWGGGFGLPLIYWLAVIKFDDRRKARLIPALGAHIDRLDRRATARRVVDRALSRNR